MDRGNFIPFVKESAKPQSSASGPERPIHSSVPKQILLNGDDVRSIYEDIVKISKSDKGSVKDSRKEDNKNVTSTKQYDKKKVQPIVKKKKVETKKNVSWTSREKDKFLAAAQNGNINEVKNMLDRGIDINTIDSFGWSAVMCAAKEGCMETVEFLLKSGANCFLVDEKGMTLHDIAKSQHNVDVLLLVESYIYNLPSNYEKNTFQETFFCDLCGVHFENSSRNSHESSTLHLFNSQHRPQSSSYTISESNKGFQMMLRSGWNMDTGLGPGGEGKKYPVKTVLKRDRKGLGLVEDSIKKAKVTHFEANDRTSVATVTQHRMLRKRTLGKQARSKQETKNRRKEMDFRLEFYGEG